MIETTKRPYEFLVRWRDSVISGAHVGFEITTTEDGVALSTTPLAVMPVNIGQGSGFPLADILAQVHVDALSDRDAAKFECAKHEATIKELQANVAELKESLKKAISA